MKKSKTKKTSDLIMKSPYEQDGKKSIQELYEEYITDPEGIIEVDGLSYYKIIQLIQIQAGKIVSVVALDTKMNLRLKDTLIDEKGNTFTVKGFEMIRLNSDTFPEWYLKISFISITGDIENMGDYLALYKQAEVN